MSAKDPSSHISSTEKQRITTLRLYRILQRACHFFQVQTSRADSPEILLQPELRANDWGRHVIFEPPSPTKVEELFRLFYILNDDTDDGMEMEESSIDDWYYTMLGGNNDIFDQLPPMTTTTCWTSVEQLQDAIRIAFRTEIDTNQEKLSDYQYWAIRAIQFLQDQQNLWRNSSVATTEGVRVTATSRCIGSTSPTAVSSVAPIEMSIFEQKYRFAYRIRVENVSKESVQLLGRYWCIEELAENGQEDDTKEKVVVDSPATGAVGHLPVLRPGQVFEYMSGTDLVSTRGVMHGHFYMARVPHDRISAKAGDHVEALSATDKFEVEVSPFPLNATDVEVS